MEWVGWLLPSALVEDVAAGELHELAGALIVHADEALASYRFILFVAGLVPIFELNFLAHEAQSRSLVGPLRGGGAAGGGSSSSSSKSWRLREEVHRRAPTLKNRI